VQDEGQWRGSDCDGARGVEAALRRVVVAVQGVDIGDVGQRRAGGGSVNLRRAGGGSVNLCRVGGRYTCSYVYTPSWPWLCELVD
jgi:hypothetical protein